MGAYGLGSCCSRQGPSVGFHGDYDESSLSVNTGGFIDSLSIYTVAQNERIFLKIIVICLFSI